MGIIQALEGRHVFGHLTTEENLAVGAFNRKDKNGVKQDFEMVYDYFPALKTSATISPVIFPAANSKCWSSGGQ